MDSENNGARPKDSKEKGECNKGDDPKTPDGGGSNIADVSSSPSASPRDKRQCMDIPPGRSQGSPQKIPSPRDFTVAASPPKFISFDEIMKAADGVTNMSLAHEIAVDKNFRIEKQELPEDSLEKKVRDIMHMAFWDVLKEKLREDPPDYSHALVLLQEVKEKVQDLLLPQHQRLRSQIDEVLDLALIEQKADHGALDIHYYAEFVISIMAKLCAPVRDEQVAKLRDITDIVPLFKSIFEVIDEMKMDMANFTIQQMRPYIQQQSAEYERTKFHELLKQQRENDMDGLEFTKAWLSRAADRVYSHSTHSPQGSSAASSASSGTSAASSGTSSVSVESPATVLNSAFMELLDWEDNLVYPETLLMDEQRFLDLQEKTKWLTLISSILLVTYNTVGAAIAGISKFKEKLKDEIAVIIGGASFSHLAEVIPNVAEHVNKEVGECLQQHGYPQLSAERQVLLKGQVESVVSPDHAVHKLMRSRLHGFIGVLAASPRPGNLQLPVGFSAVSEELSHVCGQFMRLASHNKAVFGMDYAEIIASLIKDRSDGGGNNSPQ